jgi:hypothetical protein
LTGDGVTVTLSLVAEYEISDAVLLATRVSSFQTLLYEEIQLAAREIVAARPLDELLAQRLEINALLTQTCAEKAREYGILVTQVAIKDTVLSNRIRELLMKEVEAKRLAQAALVNAREEVATLRALSNAARLARENPELLRLRELDVARQMAQTAAPWFLVLPMRFQSRQNRLKTPRPKSILLKWKRADKKSIELLNSEWVCRRKAFSFCSYNASCSNNALKSPN